MEVAVLGTGVMGAGMARSLLRSGLRVRVWNRTRSKSEPLAAEGATVAATAREAVGGADVVLTMLFDADAVLSVLADVADAFGPQTVLLQSSTVGRDGSDRIAAFAHERELRVLDLPVLGTKKPAEEGALVVLASGDPGLRDPVAAVLDAIGSRTVWAGSELGQATALKLACNAWVASINAAVAQSLALAEGFGLDPQLFLAAIKGGPTDTGYAHLKGAQMLEGDYSVSFALDGVLKDLGLIEAAGRQAGVDAAWLDALRGSYERASAAGHGGEDMAAVISVFRGDAP